MRMLGIFAIFLLSLVSIVEGAYLYKLSGKVSALREERGAEPERDEVVAPAVRRALPPAVAARLPAPASVPSFQTLAPPSTMPATPPCARRSRPARGASS
jgi:hypothetical protein